jgi:hypothetical protein
MEVICVSPTHSSELPEGKVKTTLYWDAELKAAVERLAREDERALNAYVMRVLREHVRGKETR